MKSQKRYTAFLLLLVSAIITGIVFWPVATHLNSAMFTYSGDGLKNYFAVSYYLQHNQGLHFTGMNYPFGEHLSFADGQPGLALPFKWLCSVFPALSLYGIGLTNAAVLAGIIITPVFIYKILQRFHVQDLFAFPAALLICFLSPQFFRIEAHYGLSYPFFFCAAWYLFIRAEETIKVNYTILLILLITWTGLLHFYLAVIVCLFLAAYNLPATFIQFKKTAIRQQLLRWAPVIIPILLLQLFMMLTDTVDDRPDKPWGFFYATSDWTSVFLPHVVDLFGDPAKKLFDRYWEGFAYIGIAADLFCILFVFHIILRFFIPKLRSSFPIFTLQQYLYLLAAVLLLLFSMGIPFKWGLQSLADKLPMLRQFRAPGRFAWPFYYVAGIFAVMYFQQIWQYTTNQLAKKRITAAIVAIGLLWSAECVYRMVDRRALAHRAVGNYMIIAERNIDALLKKSGRYPGEFQSILALPYFHVGSEKFSMNNGLSEINAMKAALQTGLPLMNVMMSRTSLQQSKESVQLLADSLLEKKIITKLKRKPVLILVSQSELNNHENYILSKSKLLITQNGLSLYELNPANLKVDFTTVKQKLIEHANHGKYDHGIWSSDTASSAIVWSPDTTGLIKTGAAGISYNHEVDNLFSFVPEKINAGDSMNMSMWLTIDPNAETFPILRCTQLDATGKEIVITETAFKWSTDVYANSVLTSVDFVMQPQTVKVELKLYNPGKVFNLIIRRKNEGIIIPAGKSFYFNNIFIE